MHAFKVSTLTCGALRLAHARNPRRKEDVRQAKFFADHESPNIGDTIDMRRYSVGMMAVRNAASCFG